MPLVANGIDCLCVYFLFKKNINIKIYIAYNIGLCKKMSFSDCKKKKNNTCFCSMDSYRHSGQFSWRSDGDLKQDSPSERLDNRTSG